jgi:quercetin dioxygenase-like cupin family protein
MHFRFFAAGALAILLCGIAAGQQSTRSQATTTNALILEKQEGERRVHRSAGTSTGNAPFILKFDPANGPSQHLVMFTEDLPPGASIPVHKHPECEEILILQTGHSRVHLGTTTREVGPGASVLIPPDTWISVDVVGNEPVSLIAIFSQPGFEQYMRAISVQEGEPNTPISKTELKSIREHHDHAVNYE